MYLLLLLLLLPSWLIRITVVTIIVMSSIAIMSITMIAISILFFLSSLTLPMIKHTMLCDILELRFRAQGVPGPYTLNRQE